MANLGFVLRAQSHIDRKLTLRPAETGASSGPPIDALLTSKCVKFIDSDSRMGGLTIRQPRPLTLSQRLISQTQGSKYLDLPDQVYGTLYCAEVCTGRG